MCRLPAFLFLLLLIPGFAFAKDDYYSRFNTDAFWQKLVEDAPGTRPARIRKAMVIASSRTTAPGTLRFMGEERDGDSVRYYLAYEQGEKWHVLRMPSLRSAVAMMPDSKKDWVVYTEGMGKIFTTDLDRGFGLATQYDVNVLLLDYPSIHTGYGSYKNYRFAYTNARRAYKDFLPVLDSFKALRESGAAGAGKLTLFFHSMGNNVMRKIVQRNLSHKYNDTRWVDNIVLNAPCVPRRGSRKWIDSLRFATAVFVHYNPEDQTLHWARLAGLRGILGERPKQPVSTRATYVNFNALCGRGHSNFLSLYGRAPATGEAIVHYSSLFHGLRPDMHDEQLYKASAWGVGLDILPVGHNR